LPPSFCTTAAAITFYKTLHAITFFLRYKIQDLRIESVEKPQNLLRFVEKWLITAKFYQVTQQFTAHLSKTSSNHAILAETDAIIELSISVKISIKITCSNRLKRAKIQQVVELCYAKFSYL